MLGSEYPESIDSYTAGASPFVASTVFNQLSTIMETTQRAMGQDLGNLNDISNFVDDTFAKQFKKLLRVDFGEEAYVATSGASVTGANQGSRELTVNFNTYGGSTVFNDGSKIRVFVMEQGGNLNSQTVDILGGRRRDSGNVVEGSVSMTGFRWRHDVTNFIGTILWLAVQWEE